MELTLEKAEELLQIDKNALDTICQEQPELFYRISEKFVEALSERDAAKDLLTKTEAGESLDIRIALEKNGEKVTEGKVSQMVQDSTNYQAAQSVYLKAKNRMEIWCAVKDAFLQRAQMIKILCDLHGQGYFSTASVSSKSVQEREYASVREKIANLRKEN